MILLLFLVLNIVIVESVLPSYVPTLRVNVGLRSRILVENNQSQLFHLAHADQFQWRYARARLSRNGLLTVFIFCPTLILAENSLWNYVPLAQRISVNSNWFKSIRYNWPDHYPIWKTWKSHYFWVGVSKAKVVLDEIITWFCQAEIWPVVLNHD